MTQTVRIETPGCIRASCELRNDHGTWRLAVTPGEVELITSKEPLKVVCRADDGVEGSSGAEPYVAPTTGGGAAAGGVAGGAAVGLAFGTMALAFIPVLGLAMVATGAGVGALGGQTLEASQRAIAYPALVRIPMSCMDHGTLTAAPPGSGRFGVAIRGLSRADARAAGLGDRSAVLVTNVAAGGRADMAGLRSGDIVLAVDGRDVGDAADVEERVLALVPGKAFAVRVWRDGQVLELQLTLPT